jgi:hypothetical protein
MIVNVNTKAQGREVSCGNSPQINARTARKAQT